MYLTPVWRCGRKSINLEKYGMFIVYIKQPRPFEY